MKKNVSYTPIIEGVYGKRTPHLKEAMTHIAEHMIDQAPDEKKHKRYMRKMKLRLLINTLIAASNIKHVDMTYGQKIVNMFDLKYAIYVIQD